MVVVNWVIWDSSREESLTAVSQEEEHSRPRVGYGVARLQYSWELEVELAGHSSSTIAVEEKVVCLPGLGKNIHPCLGLGRIYTPLHH